MICLSNRRQIVGACLIGESETGCFILGSWYDRHARETSDDTDFVRVRQPAFLDPLPPTHPDGLRPHFRDRCAPGREDLRQRHILYSAWYIKAHETGVMDGPWQVRQDTGLAISRIENLLESLVDDLIALQSPTVHLKSRSSPDSVSQRPVRFPGRTKNEARKFSNFIRVPPFFRSDLHATHAS